MKLIATPRNPIRPSPQGRISITIGKVAVEWSRDKARPCHPSGTEVIRHETASYITRELSAQRKSSTNWPQVSEYAAFAQSNAERPAAPRAKPSFLRESSTGCLELFAFRGVYFRIGEVEFFQSFHDGRRNCQVGKPFIVRGYHVPGSMLGRSIADHVLVGFLIVVPIFALVNVCRGELPILPRFVQSGQKAALLFFLRKMEEELANHRAVTRHVALEAANVFEALVPDVLGYERRRKHFGGKSLGMHSHDQHLFVIRAVEDADVAALRQMFGGAPEEIVLQFGLRRDFERVDLAAFGVHSRHDVLDGAIFTGCIHGLEDQQNSPMVLGVESGLQILEAVGVFLQLILGLIDRMQMAGVCGIEVFQAEILAVVDAVESG